MRFKKYIKSFLYLIIFSLVFFLSANNVIAQKEIGEQCSQNNECKTNQCFGAPGSKNYCICNSSSDCKNRYGNGDWECQKSGAYISYCYDNDSQVKVYPNQEERKGIGAECNENWECQTNTCESGHCVCANAVDCSFRYEEGNWECQTGNVYYANYCYDNDSDSTEYASETEPKKPNPMESSQQQKADKGETTAESVTTKEVELEESEIEEILAKPSLQEQIPGLNFADKTDIPIIEEGGDRYLLIPYLGQYISAIYKWSIAAAGVLAVIVIIVSAIQWMFPALNLFTEGEGNQKKTINQAKKRIWRSIGGLVIALASYTLLYTINPELVEFDALKVKYIEKKTLSPAKGEQTQSYEPVSEKVKTEKTVDLKGNASEYCFPLTKNSFDKNLNNWGDKRAGGDRCHAGVDLLTNHQQSQGEVVSIAAGEVILACDDCFYECSDGATIPEKHKNNGDNVGLLFIHHPKLDMTVNYGEIDKGKLNVEKGNKVQKGQKLGRATYCTMLHFEIYEGKVYDNIKWKPPDGMNSSGERNKCAKKYVGQIKNKPLLDPSKILRKLEGNYCN